MPSPKKVAVPPRPWHRGCGNIDCTDCPPDIPVPKDNAEERCLLCHIDREIADPEERAATYLSFADFSLMSMGVPWHCVADPCRKHNMLLPRGVGKMLDVFETVGKKYNERPVGGVDVVTTKRLVASIETQILEIHDKRDEEKVAKHGSTQSS